MNMNQTFTSEFVRSTLLGGKEALFSSRHWFTWISICAVGKSWLQIGQMDVSFIEKSLVSNNSNTLDNPIVRNSGTNQSQLSVTLQRKEIISSTDFRKSVNCYIINQKTIEWIFICPHSVELYFETRKVINISFASCCIFSTFMSCILSILYF